MDPSKFSILSWIFNNEIKNEKGEVLDYKNHLFLLNILTDWSKDIVIKKCSQIGGSVTFNLKILFAIQNFSFNAIYTFPTDSDVKEFVSSKTNKLLQSNQHVFKDIPTDNIERKEINNRFLFFKGTISKTAPIMTSADILIHDEADKSDQKTLDDYQSRTKASEFKGTWIFSNPTTEKGRVDAKWKESDQKEWFVKCSVCQLEQILKFPDNINFEKKIFICSSCKNEIDNNARRKGRWIAQNPGAKVSGYHISHLMASWITAREIIEDSQRDQEYFYNFVLGEPYNPGDISISKQTIIDCWTPRSLKTENYFLGVDVGNIKHYALGSEKGLVKIGRLKDWQELDDLLKFYKPITVIDALPDATASRYFVGNYQNVFMSFFKENSDNPKTLVWWGENDKKGIVYSNRNRILDQLIDELLNARILFNLEVNDEFREFVKHWETLRRIKTVNTKGIENYAWESTTKVDHYVFACLYYYLAKLSFGNGLVISDAKKPVEIIQERKDGQYFNIKEFLEQNEWKN